MKGLTMREDERKENKQLIGKRLYEVKKRLGVSEQKLADYLEMSLSSFRSKCKGLTELRTSELSMLRVLGISVTYICGIDNSMFIDELNGWKLARKSLGLVAE